MAQRNVCHKPPEHHHSYAGHVTDKHSKASTYSADVIWGREAKDIDHGDDRKKFGLKATCEGIELNDATEVGCEPPNKDTRHSIANAMITSTNTGKPSGTIGDYEEWRYLNAKQAAGETMILPPAMRKKLLEKIQADEAKKRANDPHYQRELLMAKVNAAEAEREAQIPSELLYPDLEEEPGIDLEDWDVLGGIDVNRPTPGRGSFLHDYSVIKLSALNQAIPINRNGKLDWLEVTYSKARKGDKAPMYKERPQEAKEAKSVDKAGWTLDDVLGVDVGMRL